MSCLCTITITQIKSHFFSLSLSLLDFESDKQLCDDNDRLMLILSEQIACKDVNNVLCWSGWKNVCNNINRNVLFSIKKKFKLHHPRNKKQLNILTVGLLLYNKVRGLFFNANIFLDVSTFFTKQERHSNISSDIIMTTFFVES
jgi:hypothetical protein